MVSAVTIAEDVEESATIVGKVASGIDDVLPWLMLAGGFIPGIDTVLSAIQIANPIIKRVATAAPIIAQTIADGMPVAQAIDAASPSVLADLKQLFALKTGVPVESVTDEQAYRFAGPVIMGRQWTDEEMQRSWDKADGAVRDSAGGKADAW